MPIIGRNVSDNWITDSKGKSFNHEDIDVSFIGLCVFCKTRKITMQSGEEFEF